MISIADQQVISLNIDEFYANLDKHKVEHAKMCLQRINKVVDKFTIPPNELRVIVSRLENELERNTTELK